MQSPSSDASKDGEKKKKKKKKSDKLEGITKRHTDGEKKKKKQHKKRKEEEEKKKTETVVIHIDEDDEEGLQKVILESVSRPPPAAAAIVAVAETAESPAIARLLEAGVVPPAPDNYMAPEPEPAPAPVATESRAEYHASMMKFKADRLHHPYYHSTVSAAEMIQFIRSCGDTLGRAPLQFTISLNHMYYVEAVKRLMDPEMDVRQLLDWLRAHFVTGSLGLNQVAVNVHTFVIPEDMPGEWAKYGL